MTEEERAELERLLELAEEEKKEEDERLLAERERQQAIREATENEIVRNRALLVERCVREPTRSYFGETEGIHALADAVRDLLSCVDQLERRIAKLESP